MQLNKAGWTSEDGEEFKKYLLTFSKEKEKGEWEKRILNTNLDCIAVPSPDVKKFVKEIFNGDYESYLMLNMRDNFTLEAINGGLISKIKDFYKMKKYLDKYVLEIDNWASCDILKFNINEKNKSEFFALANEYIKYERLFVKRVGITTLFKFVSDNEMIDSIFSILNLFCEQSDYYVDMALAWLFCECFIKQRDKTIEFLKTTTLNSFALNKGISKCRDSFRVTKDDKEMLLKYKK